MVGLGQEQQSTAQQKEQENLKKESTSSASSSSVESSSQSASSFTSPSSLPLTSEVNSISASSSSSTFSSSTISEENKLPPTISMVSPLLSDSTMSASNSTSTEEKKEKKSKEKKDSKLAMTRLLDKWTELTKKELRADLELLKTCLRTLRFVEEDYLSTLGKTALSKQQISQVKAFVDFLTVEKLGLSLSSWVMYLQRRLEGAVQQGIIQERELPPWINIESMQDGIKELLSSKIDLNPKNASQLELENEDENEKKISGASSKPKIKRPSSFKGLGTTVQQLQAEFKNCQKQSDELQRGYLEIAEELQKLAQDKDLPLEQRMHCLTVVSSILLAPRKETGVNFGVDAPKVAEYVRAFGNLNKLLTHVEHDLIDPQESNKMRGPKPDKKKIEEHLKNLEQETRLELAKINGEESARDLTTTSPNLEQLSNEAMAPDSKDPSRIREAKLAVKAAMHDLSKAQEVLISQVQLPEYEGRLHNAMSDLRRNINVTRMFVLRQSIKVREEVTHAKLKLAKMARIHPHLNDEEPELVTRAVEAIAALEKVLTDNVEIPERQLSAIKSEPDKAMNDLDSAMQKKKSSVRPNSTALEEKTPEFPLSFSSPISAEQGVEETKNSPLTPPPFGVKSNEFPSSRDLSVIEQSNLGSPQPSALISSQPSSVSSSSSSSSSTESEIDPLVTLQSPISQSSSSASVQPSLEIKIISRLTQASTTPQTSGVKQIPVVSDDEVLFLELVAKVEKLDDVKNEEVRTKARFDHLVRESNHAKQEFQRLEKTAQEGSKPLLEAKLRKIEAEMAMEVAAEEAACASVARECIEAEVAIFTAQAKEQPSSADSASTLQEIKNYQAAELKLTRAKEQLASIKRANSDTRSRINLALSAAKESRTQLEKFAKETKEGSKQIKELEKESKKAEKLVKQVEQRLQQKQAEAKKQIARKEIRRKGKPGRNQQLSQAPQLTLKPESRLAKAIEKLSLELTDLREKAATAKAALSKANIEAAFRPSLIKQAQKNADVQSAVLERTYKRIQAEITVLALQPTSSDLDLLPQHVRNLSAKFEEKRKDEQTEIQGAEQEALVNAERVLKEAELAEGRVLEEAKDTQWQVKQLETSLETALQMGGLNTEEIKLRGIGLAVSTSEALIRAKKLDSPEEWEQEVAKSAIGIMYNVLQQQVNWMKEVKNCQLNDQQLAQFDFIQNHVEALSDAIQYLHKQFLQANGREKSIPIIHPDTNKETSLPMDTLNAAIRTIQSTAKPKDALKPLSPQRMTRMGDAQRNWQNLGQKLSALCLNQYSALLESYDLAFLKLADDSIQNPSSLALKQRRQKCTAGAYINNNRARFAVDENLSGVHQLAVFFNDFAKQLQDQTNPSNNSDEIKLSSLSSPLPSVTVTTNSGQLPVQPPESDSSELVPVNSFFSLFSTPSEQQQDPVTSEKGSEEIKLTSLNPSSDSTIVTTSLDLDKKAELKDQSIAERRRAAIEEIRDNLTKLQTATATILKEYPHGAMLPPALLQALSQLAHHTRQATKVCEEQIKKIADANQEDISHCIETAKASSGDCQQAMLAISLLSGKPGGGKEHKYDDVSKDPTDIFRTRLQRFLEIGEYFRSSFPQEPKKNSFSDSDLEDDEKFAHALMGSRMGSSSLPPTPQVSGSSSSFLVPPSSPFSQEPASASTLRMNVYSSNSSLMPSSSPLSQEPFSPSTPATPVVSVNSTDRSFLVPHSPQGRRRAFSGIGLRDLEEKESKKSKLHRGPLDGKQTQALVQRIRSSEKQLSLEGRETKWERNFLSFPAKVGSAFRATSSKTRASIVANSGATNATLDAMLKREREAVYNINSTVLKNVDGIGDVRVFPARTDGNLPGGAKGHPYFPKAEYFGLGIDAVRGFLEAIKYNSDDESQKKMMSHLTELLEGFQLDLNSSTDPKEMRQAVFDLEGCLVNLLDFYEVCEDVQQANEMLSAMRYFVHEKTFHNQAACYITPPGKKQEKQKDKQGDEREEKKGKKPAEGKVASPFTGVMMLEFDSPVDVGVPADKASGIRDPWDGYEKSGWYKKQQKRLGDVWYRSFVQANLATLRTLPNKSMETHTPGPRNARDITLIAVDDQGNELVRQNYSHVAFPEPFGIKDEKEQAEITKSNLAAMVIGQDGERLKRALRTALQSPSFQVTIGKGESKKIVVPFMHASLVRGFADTGKSFSKIANKKLATQAVSAWIREHPPYLQDDGEIVLYGSSTPKSQRQGTEILVPAEEDNTVINFSRKVLTKSNEDIQHILATLAHRANALNTLTPHVPEDLSTDWQRIIDFINPKLKTTWFGSNVEYQASISEDVAPKISTKNPSETDVSLAIQAITRRLADSKQSFGDLSLPQRLAIARRIQAACEIRALRAGIKLRNYKDGYQPRRNEHEAVQLQILTRADADEGVLPATLECMSSCDRAEEVARHVVAQINYALNSPTHSLLLMGGPVNMEQAWEDGLISEFPVAVKLRANGWRTGSEGVSDGETQGPQTLKDSSVLRQTGVISGFSRDKEQDLLAAHHSTRKGKANLDMNLEKYRQKLEERRSKQTKAESKKKNRLPLDLELKGKPVELTRPSSEQKQKPPSLEIEMHEITEPLAGESARLSYKEQLARAIDLLSATVEGVNIHNTTFTSTGRKIKTTDDDEDDSNQIRVKRVVKKEIQASHSRALTSVKAINKSHDPRKLAYHFNTIITFFNVSASAAVNPEGSNRAANLEYIQLLEGILSGCFQASDDFYRVSQQVDTPSRQVTADEQVLRGQQRTLMGQLAAEIVSLKERVATFKKANLPVDTAPVLESKVEEPTATIGDEQLTSPLTETEDGVPRSYSSSVSSVSKGEIQPPESKSFMTSAFELFKKKSPRAQIGTLEDEVNAKLTNEVAQLLTFIRTLPLRSSKKDTNKSNVAQGFILVDGRRYRAVGIQWQGINKLHAKLVRQAPSKRKGSQNDDYLDLRQSTIELLDDCIAMLSSSREKFGQNKREEFIQQLKGYRRNISAEVDQTLTAEDNSGLWYADESDEEKCPAPQPETSRVEPPRGSAILDKMEVKTVSPVVLAMVPSLISIMNLLDQAPLAQFAASSIELQNVQTAIRLLEEAKMSGSSRVSEADGLVAINTVVNFIEIRLGEIKQTASSFLKILSQREALALLELNRTLQGLAVDYSGVDTEIEAVAKKLKHMTQTFNGWAANSNLDALSKVINPQEQQPQPLENQQQEIEMNDDMEVKIKQTSSTSSPQPLADSSTAALSSSSFTSTSTESVVPEEQESPREIHEVKRRFSRPDLLVQTAALGPSLLTSSSTGETLLLTPTEENNDAKRVLNSSPLPAQTAASGSLFTSSSSTSSSSSFGSDSSPVRVITITIPEEAEEGKNSQRINEQKGLNSSDSITPASLPLSFTSSPTDSTQLPSIIFGSSSSQSMTAPTRLPQSNLSAPLTSPSLFSTTTPSPPNISNGKPHLANSPSAADDDPIEKLFQEQSQQVKENRRVSTAIKDYRAAKAEERSVVQLLEGMGVHKQDRDEVEDGKTSSDWPKRFSRMFKTSSYSSTSPLAQPLLPADPSSTPRYTSLTDLSQLKRKHKEAEWKLNQQAEVVRQTIVQVTKPPDSTIKGEVVANLRAFWDGDKGDPSEGVILGSETTYPRPEEVNDEKEYKVKKERKKERKKYNKEGTVNRDFPGPLSLTDPFAGAGIGIGSLDSDHSWVLLPPSQTDSQGNIFPGEGSFGSTTGDTPPNPPPTHDPRVGMEDDRSQITMVEPAHRESVDQPQPLIQMGNERQWEMVQLPVPGEDLPADPVAPAALPADPPTQRSRRDWNRIKYWATTAGTLVLGSLIGVFSTAISFLSYYAGLAIPPGVVYAGLWSSVMGASAIFGQNQLRYTRRNIHHILLDIPDVHKTLLFIRQRLDQNPGHDVEIRGPMYDQLWEFVLSSLKALHEEDARFNNANNLQALRVAHGVKLHGIWANLRGGQQPYQMSLAHVQELQDWVRFLASTPNLLVADRSSFTDRHPKTKAWIITIGSPVCWMTVLVGGFFGMNQLDWANSFIGHQLGSDAGSIKDYLQMAKTVSLTWVIIASAVAASVAVALHRWLATQQGQNDFRDYREFLDKEISLGEVVAPEDEPAMYAQVRAHVGDVDAGNQRPITLNNPLTHRASDLPRPWPGSWAAWIKKEIVGDALMLFHSPLRFFELPGRRQFKHFTNLFFTGLTIGLLASNPFTGSIYLAGALMFYLTAQLIQEFRAGRESRAEFIWNQSLDALIGNPPPPQQEVEVVDLVVGHENNVAPQNGAVHGAGQQPQDLNQQNLNQELGIDPPSRNDGSDLELPDLSPPRSPLNASSSTSSEISMQGREIKEEKSEVEQARELIPLLNHAHELYQFFNTNHPDHSRRVALLSVPVKHEDGQLLTLVARARENNQTFVADYLEGLTQYALPQSISNLSSISSQGGSSEFKFGASYEPGYSSDEEDRPLSGRSLSDSIPPVWQDPEKRDSKKPERKELKQPSPSRSFSSAFFTTPNAQRNTPISSASPSLQGTPEKKVQNSVLEERVALIIKNVAEGNVLAIRSFLEMNTASKAIFMLRYKYDYQGEKLTLAQIAAKNGQVEIEKLLTNKAAEYLSSASTPSVSPQLSSSTSMMDSSLSQSQSPSPMPVPVPPTQAKTLADSLTRAITSPPPPSSRSSDTNLNEERHRSSPTFSINGEDENA